MANTSSAKKRIRQIAKRRLRNRYKLVTTRTLIKTLRKTKEKETATSLFPRVVSMIDRCSKHHIFHRNKAANLKSKLAKYINTL
ncbi:MAG: 30S ribosomal protein S20 [Bacteroidia bacterium]|nr:30S ribosomal protein S20 [Bacteroidia bacterium]